MQTESCKMKLFILILALLPCVLVAQDAEYPASYIIFAPKTIRPGLTFTLSISIREARGPVAISAQIRDKGNIGSVAEGSTSVAQGEETSLDLQIPDDLGPPLGQYQLEVIGEGGGISINQTEWLAFSVTHFAIFIQTDKAIYKPGQTVHYRVLGVYPGMLPYTGPFDIQIKDKDDNVISLLRGMQNETYGVVTQSMVMASEPVLGDWKITAMAEGQEKTQVFTVAEYVLPKFDVNVDLPTFLSEEDALRVKVTTNYTYGKPVSGSVEIILSFLYQSATIVTTVQIDGKDNVNAETEFSHATLLDLYQRGNPHAENLKYTEINVTAIVTEGLTGLQQVGNAEVRYYSRPIKVELLPTSSNVFKPGIRYLAYLMFSYQDGAPLSTTDRREGFCVDWEMYTPREGQSVTSQCPMIPDTGVAEVTYNVSQEATSLTMKVFYYRRSTQEKAAGQNDLIQYLTKMDSPSQTYLQIHLDTDQVHVDQEVTLRIVTTVDPGKLAYEVIAQSNIVLSDSVNSTSLSTIITFRVTAHMTPKARVVVSFITAGGEVVVDSIELQVAGAFRNQVDVSFSRDTSEPGEDISFSVEASPNSLVGILAVDQSVLILKSGNDITQHQVIRDLSAIDTTVDRGSDYPPIRFRRKRDVYYPFYSSGSSAKRILSDAGLLVFSDALVHGYDFPVFFDYDRPVLEAAPADQDKNSGKIPAGNRDTAAGPGEGTVRKEFPETWLWTDAVTDAEGHVTFRTTVPDTITSWLGSAFAVSLSDGLGVSSDPVKTTVFKPFFVSPNLPYSVIRNEKLILEATVFNYFNKDLTATVSLKKDVYYEAISSENGVEKSSKTGMTEKIVVPVGSGAKVSFPIKIVKAGFVNLEVRAESTLAVDTVRRQLPVKFEGVEKDPSESRLFRSDSVADFEETFTIAVPTQDMVIDGSVRVALYITGDLLGSTMSNLDNLLKMPYGCGEQNMMNFAPDVFVYEYLTETNRNSPAIKEKAFRFMLTGYQRELTYRHKDGSFSAFGSRDKSGSVWLTAFVVRSFSGASRFIFVDPEVIDKAVNFMVGQQQRDGTFFEPGRIVDRGIEGGVTTPTGLAAYIAIAIKEAVNNQNLTQRTQDRAVSSLSLVKTYLEGRLSAIEGEPFALALVTYALAVLESDQVTRFKTALDTLAIIEGNERYWSTKDEKVDPEDFWRRPYPGPVSKDVEMTAYALLAYLRMGDHLGAVSIIRWMTKQQNKQGGFGSTQDTVVGLQSLTEYALRVPQVDPQVDLEVTLSSDPLFSRSILIDPDNAIVRHQIELLAQSGTVTVRGRGKGSCLMTLGITYNSGKTDVSKPFEYTISLEEGSNPNRIEIEACGRYMGEAEVTSMCLMDIGILSGFTADTDELAKILDDNPLVQKYETDKDSVYLYFQEIPKDQTTCVTVHAVRSNNVANIQPKYGKLYDYYNPGEQAVVEYTYGALEDSNVCDVCSDCTGCSSGPGQPLLSVVLLMVTLCVAVFIGRV